jgi:hypothetical protein
MIKCLQLSAECRRHHTIALRLKVHYWFSIPACCLHSRPAAECLLTIMLPLKKRSLKMYVIQYKTTVAIIQNGKCPLVQVEIVQVASWWPFTSYCWLSLLRCERTMVLNSRKVIKQDFTINLVDFGFFSEWFIGRLHLKNDGPPKSFFDVMTLLIYFELRWSSLCPKTYIKDRSQNYLRVVVLAKFKMTLHTTDEQIWCLKVSMTLFPIDVRCSILEQWQQ